MFAATYTCRVSNLSRLVQGVGVQNRKNISCLDGILLPTPPRTRLASAPNPDGVRVTLMGRPVTLAEFCVTLMGSKIEKSRSGRVPKKHQKIITPKSRPKAPKRTPKSATILHFFGAPFSKCVVSARGSFQNDVGVPAESKTHVFLV